MLYKRTSFAYNVLANTNAKLLVLQAMRNKKVLFLLLLLLDLLVIFTSQLVGVKGSDEKVWLW